MKKLITVFILAILLCAASLQAASTCYPKFVNDRWYSFTTVIGKETFVDYLQIASADSCGNVKARNSYGTEFIGFRRKLADGSWLYDLQMKSNCFYLDAFTFILKECMNPNAYWHFGQFKCQSAASCVDCYDKLCAQRHITLFKTLPPHTSPPEPEIKELWKQYNKWRAEKGS